MSIVTLGIGGVSDLDSFITTGLESNNQAVATYTQPITASATDDLVHAEATMGKRNMAYILITLTDETGEVLVDENGAELTAYGETPVIVLHARATNDLIHAEDET